MLRIIATSLPEADTVYLTAPSLPGNYTVFVRAYDNYTFTTAYLDLEVQTPLTDVVVLPETFEIIRPMNDDRKKLFTRRHNDAEIENCGHGYHINPYGFPSIL